MDGSTFDGELLGTGRGGHAVSVPKPVAAGFPDRRVLAEVNGTSYETRLATYSGQTYLGIRQALLKSLGVAAGDVVHVVLRDAPAAAEPEPETVGPAVELDSILDQDPAFAAGYARLPTEHRDEYRRWVAGGATAAERTARAERVRHRLVPGPG
jgi:hypothetical protein